MHIIKHCAAGKINNKVLYIPIRKYFFDMLPSEKSKVQNSYIAYSHLLKRWENVNLYWYLLKIYHESLNTPPKKKLMCLSEGLGRDGTEWNSVEFPVYTFNT